MAYPLIIILIYFTLPLWVGWIMDKVFGDPLGIPHPIVGFGKLIAWGERGLNKGRRKIRKGGLLAIGLIFFTFIFSAGILLALFLVSPWIYVAISAILIFNCLAGTTLIREVRMVFKAVDRSLEEGRRQVARIVGRDTSELSAQEVRTAALETLSENLSDGVIAPLFWYMLLGLPGMLAYKMINTLDSMIGYKNERYLLFGRIAARIDDAANYIPARITAGIMVLVSGRWSLMKFVRRYGRQHASPNSGYPEAALAGILNCRFGGSHDYFGETVHKPYIGENERELTTENMEKAVRINQRAEVFAVILVTIVQLLISMIFLLSLV